MPEPRAGGARASAPDGTGASSREPARGAGRRASWPEAPAAATTWGCPARPGVSPDSGSGVLGAPRPTCRGKPLPGTLARARPLGRTATRAHGHLPVRRALRHRGHHPGLGVGLGLGGDPALTPAGRSGRQRGCPSPPKSPGPGSPGTRRAPPPAAAPRSAAGRRSRRPGPPRRPRCPCRRRRRLRHRRHRRAGPIAPPRGVPGPGRDRGQSAAPDAQEARRGPARASTWRRDPKGETGKPQGSALLCASGRPFLGFTYSERPLGLGPSPPSSLSAAKPRWWLGTSRGSRTQTEGRFARVSSRAQSLIRRVP